ncbi:Type III effector protein (Skwp5) (plasmid) [Cupriavidus necator]|nr:Type III effector protein (Skwp5) [Cupriavidus necator]
MERYQIAAAAPSRKRPARDAIEALDERHHSRMRIEPSEPQRRSRNLGRVLTYPEHEFGRQLRNQRYAQQQVLSGNAKDADFPELAIRMARENVLAQRNGYGQALVFLRPDYAGDNLHFLDLYLQKLQVRNKVRNIPPARANDVREAVELAAHYLVDTDWCRGAPAASYVHFANKLSKHADSEICRLALRSIATELLRPGALHRLNGRQAAMLCNALSKAPERPACCDAVSGLVRHLRSHGLIPGLNAQDMSNVLNALSKWSDDGRVRENALELARRVAADAPLRESMNALGVAITVNALSKWPDEADARQAALRLAERVTSDAKLRQRMDGQHVANALNAFSKWPASHRVSEAVRCLARRLTSDPQLCQSMEAWAVANALNALSKWPDQAKARDAALRLAERVSSEPQLCQSMEAQAVANALNALSKWPGEVEARDAALRLAGRLASDPRLRQSMDALAVANALNALSKWPGADEASAAALALADRLTSEAEGDARLRESMDAREVTNALNALSKWPDKEEAREAALRLAERVSSEPKLCQSMEAWAVATALNALSKWPEEDKARDAALRLAERVSSEPQLCQSMEAWEVTNALNALSKWPEEDKARDAALRLAERVSSEPQLCQSMEAKHVSNALNALSKWPDKEEARKAALQLAERVSSEPQLCQSMEAQAVANALNAFSKWPDADEASAAALALADRLTSEAEGDARLRESMDAREVTNALNALSKWPDKEEARKAALRLAERVSSEPQLCQSMEAKHVSNALNAFSKWPDADEASAAALALADRLTSEAEGDARLRESMEAREVTTALNALSKWPDKEEARKAALRLAERVSSEPQLRQSMEARAVATALNALSKWPDQAKARDAALRLAERVSSEPQLCQSMEAKHVSNALNALSKWSDKEEARKAVLRLAERVSSEPQLCQSMEARAVANALNALSKWPGEDEARDAALRLAERVSSEPQLCQSMEAKHVANALNALSKWPDADEASAAALALADRLTSEAEGDARLRQSMDAQAVASTLHALSRWPQESGLHEAAWCLAARLGWAPLEWSAFEFSQTGQIANALARLGRDEDGNAVLARDVLMGVAVHLELYPERFDSAEGRHVGMLLKAFAQLRMHDALRPLATPALERVMTLCLEGRLREEPLESVGTLCMGLLPLARSPQLQRHRVRALQTFDALKPVVEHKIDAYLRQAPGGAGARAGLRLKEGDEACGTRCPALSLYQVLKAYSVVAHQWKPRYISGERESVKTHQETLKQWVRQTLDRTRPLIETDLQEKSWNLIAQIEADDAILDALDLRLASAAHLEALTTRYPPRRFDLAARHESLRTAVGNVVPPEPSGGDTTHVTVDLRGRELEPAASSDGAEPAYSFYSRLTGQPLVEVRLPGELSAFMLARTFQYKDEPWRFDMFGGSRLTRGRRKSARDIAAGRSASASVLPAVRYADSAPGSAFMELAQKLAPQREDWSRMQRALMEMVPPDHVVEGTLRLGWFEDVPGPQHPFRLQGPHHERIALCPNDGCGFLRWDVAMRIPVVREHIEAWEAVREARGDEAQQKLVDGQQPGFNTLPPQALMHFPRDEAALDEAREVMQRRLNGVDRHASQAVDCLTLYQLAVSGGYQGRRIRAVPSADDRLYLPTIPLPGFAQLQGDVLVGKPPYDKENLLPIAAAQVVTPDQEDVTAQFLDQCFAIQYSYTGFDEDSGTGADMLHSKGMLIIPPPGYWSPDPDHQGLHLACSREDLKTLSRWKSRRERDTLPQQMFSTGSLRVKDVLLPGRLGAIPIAELRKRSMDTDGDDAFVYAGYPALVGHIGRVMQSRQARRGEERSFKPPKTAHPAIDERGRYQAGRAREIMAEQRGGALLGKAATLAMRFLAQPDELREAMARNMMFGTYDGVARDLRNGLRRRLQGDKDAPALQQLQVQAHEAIDRAHEPQACEAAKLLYELCMQLGRDSVQAPQLPSALAQGFPALASAYEQADDTAGRVHAVLDNYPVCRLSRTAFPEGQPGLVPGEPELSMRNLFTIAIKVGTDALKSDTGTDLFTSVIESCEMAERRYPDRLRRVPYSKPTLAEIRHGRFDPQWADAALRQMPTMAAGVMQDAVRALQQAELLSVPATPAERAQEVSREALEQEALALNERARLAEPGITMRLQDIVNGCSEPGHARAGLAGEQKNRLKSPRSLQDKLARLIGGVPPRTLAQASALVNDALRYSVVLPADTFMGDYRQIMAQLAKAHTLIRRTNHFLRGRSPFQAVSVTLKEPNGIAWEIQFHTEQTFRCKEKYHDLYKQAQRRGFDGASGDEIWTLLGPAREAFRALPVPAGVEDIVDWEPETVLKVQPRPQASATPRVPAPLAQLAQQIRSQAERLEGAVWPVLQQALEHHGAKLRADMDGGGWRRFIFKKKKSIEEKLARIQREQGLQTPQEAARRVRDGLRYEVILGAERFAMDARRILTSLQRAGMTVMRVNNSFTREGTGYAGLNVNVRTRVEGEDADWEIQFHTRDSLKAKEKGHRTYERLRQLSPDAVPRGTLEEDLRDAAARVAPPQGIEMILSFDLYAEPSIADERPGGPMNQPYRGAAADQARSSDLDTGQPYGPHGATRSAPAVTHPAPDPGHAVRSNWGPRPPRAPDVLSGLHDPPGGCLAGSGARSPILGRIQFGAPAHQS